MKSCLRQDMKKKLLQLVLVLSTLAIPVTPHENVECSITEKYPQKYPSPIITLNSPERFANISSLGLAIVKNDLQKMDTLLHSGICDPNDNTTLYTRSCSVHYCGFDGFPFTSGLSSLHIAVVQDNIDALEKLLAVEDIVVDSVDENGETPLFYATSTVNETPLFYATSTVNFNFNFKLKTETKLRMMNLLIEAGADIDAGNNDGKTALMQAASYNWPLPIGQVEVVTFLIEKGADIKLMSKNGDSVLNYAFDDNYRNSIHGDTEIWYLLSNAFTEEELEANANFLLAFAVRDGDLEKMKMLVEEHNADIEDGFALSIAIKGQNFEAVKYLVEAGGKLDSETKEEAARGRISGWKDVGGEAERDWELLKFLVKLGAVPDNKYSCQNKDTKGCNCTSFTCILDSF